MTTAPLIRAYFTAAIGDDHTGAGAAYAALGSATTQVAQSLVITSSFDASVFLSLDGSANHIMVPPGDSGPCVINIDFSSFKQGTGKLGLPKGTQFYMKQGPDGAPSSGDLYISVIYGR